MSTNLEIEVKSTLTQHEYNELMRNFDAHKTYIQSNYYIDSDDLIIHKNRCGLRIRGIDDKFELTLKAPAQDGKLEITQQISYKIYENYAKRHRFPEGEVKDYLEREMGIDLAKIHILGKLVTYRHDVKYKSSLISIDESHYFDKIDYEIECEGKSLRKVERHLSQFLKKYHIEYKKSSVTKLQRFLEALK